jgi:glycosyltransferase involved in cell wall biosynthesis
MVYGGAIRQALANAGYKGDIRVVYNGVPNDAVHLDEEQKRSIRLELGLPVNAFIVGHVGGCIELRDQAAIIRAMVKCIERGVDAYLVMVGDGPLRNRLGSTCERLGIGDRTKWLGYRGDVRRLLPVFDVYVNMAREEGFGIAVVEAMQASVPVVLANAGALPELIENAVSGIVVRAGDEDQLAEALQTLHKNREMATRLGSAGRHRALKIFAISEYVRKMETLYIEVSTGTSKVRYRD